MPAYRPHVGDRRRVTTGDSSFNCACCKIDTASQLTVLVLHDGVNCCMTAWRFYVGQFFYFGEIHLCLVQQNVLVTGPNWGHFGSMIQIWAGPKSTARCFHPESAHHLPDQSSRRAAVAYEIGVPLQKYELSLCVAGQCSRVIAGPTRPPPTVVVITINI